MRKALNEGKDVIFDATNLSKRQRKRDISGFRKDFPDLKVIGVVFDVDKTLLHERINSRNCDDINYVTKEVIDRQLQTLNNNFPNKDEFDELEIVYQTVPLRDQIQQATIRTDSKEGVMTEQIEL